MKWIFRSSLIMFSLLLGTVAYGQESKQESSPVNANGASKKITNEQPVSEKWFDSTHLITSESADNAAIWLDEFFGDPRTDLESANSSLRLIFENDWEEYQGNDSDVHLRGKVHLPRINKRLSLIFSDQEDQPLNDDTPKVIDETNSSTKVSLQYNAKDSQKTRLDYNLGLSSNLKLKASVRYRYQDKLLTDYLGRITEKLYFIDGEGFGSRTHLDIERAINETSFLRLTNRVKFSEDSDGAEWGTTLQLAKRLNDDSAFSYFVWSSGQTRPDYLTSSYGVGLRYRTSFYRPWLFVEIEPSYAWLRSLDSNERKPTALLSFKFEILLERDELKQKK